MKKKVFYEDVHVSDFITKRVRTEKRAYVPAYSSLSADLLRDFLAEYDGTDDVHETPHYLYREIAEHWVNYGTGRPIPQGHKKNIQLWYDFLVKIGKLKIT